MATPASRSERVYHQDYIARIRYANPLPPPPNGPKLLDIPNTGLTSGQYTSASFASRMAREQPINIEADAELGMPIDLVGMPGIFDGDESSIQAPAQPPPMDPRDRALLRPLSSLGKPTAITSGVSFLRRTEYISSEQGRSRFESTTSSGLVRSTGHAKPKRKLLDESQDDPMNILRSVLKGFDLANPEEAYTGGDDASGNVRRAVITQAEREAWNKPKHPTKKKLTMVESYPVLPDLDAYPDSGGYIVTKFATNPMAESDTYDTRLDVGLLRPLPLAPDYVENLNAQSAAHGADPSKPAPGPPHHDYEYFLPLSEADVGNIQRKFDVDDPQRDDPNLYASTMKHNQEPCFNFKRVRAYETVSATASSLFEEVAVVLHDPKDSGKRLQKAAYYYPIMQKSQIRPRRTTKLTFGLSQSQRQEEEADRIDYLNVTVGEPSPDESRARSNARASYDVEFEVET
ncbi:MAG: hypothetical protein M1836_002087 [Candelina mexicana]|nr:MAG: hypothetical protein M1836_002087 [Candelina mexicana]